jgi:hypothetical protein
LSPLGRDSSTPQCNSRQHQNIWAENLQSRQKLPNIVYEDIIKKT